MLLPLPLQAKDVCCRGCASFPLTANPMWPRDGAIIETCAAKLSRLSNPWGGKCKEASQQFGANSGNQWNS